MKTVEEKAKAYDEAIDKVLAWLEKQSEQKQKPTDKFHEGDWVVVNNVVYHIDKISGVYLTLSTPDGTALVYHISVLDSEHTHLWTIQDAKDSDVLASKDGKNILIFRRLDTSISLSSYYNTSGKGELGWSNRSFIPATKEQCDTLMKAMADAGYTFDFDKKELKKIEQPSSWSEEDEKTLQGIIDEIEANKHSAPDYDLVTYDRFLSWLKSLKDRVQPLPKQEWSKDAITRIDEIIETLNIVQANRVRTQRMHYSKATIDKNIDWLKSLKEKCTWKPSDEQMDALLNILPSSSQQLFSLYNNLKKLK